MRKNVRHLAADTCLKMSFFKLIQNASTRNDMYTSFATIRASSTAHLYVDMYIKVDLNAMVE